MEERSLLLLGLLLVQQWHGYQLNEFIEKNLGRITDIKKPTAYATLDRLQAAGFVNEHTEQEGNRPPRKVYAITEAGRAEFLRLLRANLSTQDRIFYPGDIGLMFIDQLPVSEVRALLSERLKGLHERLRQYETVPRHERQPGVDLAVERMALLLRTESEWLQGVIDRFNESAREGRPSE